MRYKSFYYIFHDPIFSNLPEVMLHQKNGGNVKIGRSGVQEIRDPMKKRQEGTMQEDSEGKFQNDSSLLKLRASVQTGRQKSPEIRILRYFFCYSFIVI